MRKLTLAACLAAYLPWGVAAQALASDPSAPVPPVPYHSALVRTQALPPSTEPALADWQQANAAVGQNLRGHIDILKWEAANALPALPADQPSAESLTPAQAVTLALKQQPALIDTPPANALALAQRNLQVQQLSHRVLRAWILAVAAHQTEAQLRQVAHAARTGAELGQRMARVGNWSKMQMLQEQLVLSAAISQLTLAQQASFSATEDLVRLLGLWGSAAQLALPAQLPKLPATEIKTPNLEASALRHQPELAVARIGAEQAAAGVTEPHWRQWQQALDAALQDAMRPTDVALGQLSTAPILDPRHVPLTHALERGIRAQAQAHALAVATRSQAREAYYRWRTAADMAQHQREAVGLATALQEETQLRYNGMLSSIWDLLASARNRLQSELAASQAQRDAWLAYLDLQAVQSGVAVSFSSTSSAAGSAPTAKPGH